jgi:hypothetical protein
VDCGLSLRGGPNTQGNLTPQPETGRHDTSRKTLALSDSFPADSLFGAIS